MPTIRASLEPPFAGCEPLFAPGEVRAADVSAAEDLGIPTIVLMERAGLEAARAIQAAYGDLRKVTVVVGRGNNGGDGMVVARHLADAGWCVAVEAPDGREPGTPDAQTMTRIAGACGIGVAPLGDPSADPDRLVVDALLGTGARGAPEGGVAKAVAAIGRAAGPVVSLDVPSGVDGETGEVPGDAVRADLTLTFHGDKTGLHVAPGLGHCGRIVVVDIGIPAVASLEPTAWLTTRAAALALPRKAADTEKYGAGAVLVVAGSPGLTGACVLASRATLRAGAGLVVAAVPAAVREEVAGRLVEVMTAGLPDENGHLGVAALDAVIAQSRRVGALALGPGLGRAAGTTAFVRQVLERLELPAVIDADALWHLGQAAAWIGARPGSTVLTPHAGEAARLLGVEREQVERARLASARALAERTGSVVVLKGPGTLTVAPDGRLAVNSTGGPELATAGSGDVLTGIVAAALAKGLDPFQAAAIGVAAHGETGRVAGKGDATVASDLIEALAEVVGVR